MGVLCLKCESSLKENEETDNKPKSRDYDLPKQYVNNIDLNDKSDGEEETILKFEKDDIPKTGHSENNTHDNAKDDNNKQINNKDINNKDINSVIIDNNNNKNNDDIKDNNNIDNINNKNDKKIDDNKSNNNIKTDNSNSNRSSYKDNIIKIFNKSKSTFLKSSENVEENQKNNIFNNCEENLGRKNNAVFQTVKNPKDFKNKIREKNMNINDLNLNKGAIKEIFQRKKKRSTTLMENSKLLQQLFLVEMSMPITQESLVLQQKGNPSEKYIRGKKIGSGTFGSVYESKNIIFNSKVAMKVIQKDYYMDNELIKNEIDILKKLSHPNIVRIYEFFETKNCFYLVNEFCPEGELYNYINNSKLNEQQLSVIFYQVFSGLNYLHQNNIIHRDFKPENILISKKERDLLSDEEYFWIKIIDFGTAKIFKNDQNEDSVVGSPYYIAPEVLNKDYNEKCDTWSIGVILYMFLVGKPPFNGANNYEIINSIKTKNYDENNPKLLTHSEEVRDLISHLLEKDTNKRFSAKEALNHKWFKKFNARILFGNFREQDIQPYIDNLFNYTCSSKIQQLVIAFLVHNLPHTESSNNIIKLYRYFNISGDCELTKEELINGLNKYRDKELVNEKVDNIFSLLDGDRNGHIECEEFLRACIDKKEILNDEYLKYAFKFLDKENTGLLNDQTIISAFLTGENKLFEVAVNKVINDVDEDGDGMINFEEFKQLMLKTMN
jgi:calcium-dependent protein kinase